MPSQSEHPDSEPEPEQEPQPIDPGILLDQTAIDEPQKAPGESTQRASARSNKGTITSKKFADETYVKAQRIRLAKMARHKKDPNDEDEPETVKEALNHPERGKQWEKAIQDEVNAHLKTHTWDIVPRNSKSASRIQQVYIQTQKERTCNYRQIEGQASGTGIQSDLRRRLPRHLCTSRQPRINQDFTRNRGDLRIGDSSDGRCDGIFRREIGGRDLYGTTRGIRDWEQGRFRLSTQKKHLRFETGTKGLE
jgi:hypothetical protein